MRLLNIALLGLLAASAFVFSGCHAAGMHAFCMHTPAAPAATVIHVHHH